MEKLVSEMAGKSVADVIAAGSTKLASVPSGGAAPAAAAAAAAPAAGGAPAKEEKKKEEPKVRREPPGGDPGLQVLGIDTHDGALTHSVPHCFTGGGGGGDGLLSVRLSNTPLPEAAERTRQSSLACNGTPMQWALSTHASRTGLA